MTDWDNVKITVASHTPAAPAYYYRVVDGVFHCAESCAWCGGGPMTEVQRSMWQCSTGAALLKLTSEALERLEEGLLG